LMTEPFSSFTFEDPTLNSLWNKLVALETEIYQNELDQTQATGPLAEMKKVAEEFQKKGFPPDEQVVLFEGLFQEMVDRFESYILAKSMVPFDIRKLRFLIREGLMSQKNLKGNRLSFLFGKTGAGKSTTMHFLAEVKILKTMIATAKNNLGFSAQKEVLTPQTELPGFELGHEKKSKTKIVRAYEHTFEGEVLFLVDTPGYLDLRGPEMDISHSVCINWAITNSASVLPIFLVPYDSICGSSKDGLALINQFIVDLFPNLEMALKHLVIWFTHAPPQSHDRLFNELNLYYGSISAASNLTNEEKKKYEALTAHMILNLSNGTGNVKILFPTEHDPKIWLSDLKKRDPIKGLQGIQYKVTQESRLKLRSAFINIHDKIRCFLLDENYVRIYLELQLSFELVSHFDEECLEQILKDCGHSIRTDLQYKREQTCQFFELALDSRHQMNASVIDSVINFYSTLKKASILQKLPDFKNWDFDEREFIKYLIGKVNGVSESISNALKHEDPELDWMKISEMLEKLQLLRELKAVSAEFEKVFERSCSETMNTVEEIGNSCESDKFHNEPQKLGCWMSNLVAAETHVQKFFPSFLISQKIQTAKKNLQTAIFSIFNSVCKQLEVSEVDDEIIEQSKTHLERANLLINAESLRQFLPVGIEEAIKTQFTTVIVDRFYTICKEMSNKVSTIGEIATCRSQMKTLVNLKDLTPQIQAGCAQAFLILRSDLENRMKSEVAELYNEIKGISSESLEGAFKKNSLKNVSEKLDELKECLWLDQYMKGIVKRSYEYAGKRFREMGRDLVEEIKFFCEARQFSQVVSLQTQLTIIAQTRSHVDQLGEFLREGRSRPRATVEQELNKIREERERDPEKGKRYLVDDFVPPYQIYKEIKFWQSLTQVSECLGFADLVNEAFDIIFIHLKDQLGVYRKLIDGYCSNAENLIELKKGNKILEEPNSSEDFANLRFCLIKIQETLGKDTFEWENPFRTEIHSVSQESLNRLETSFRRIQTNLGRSINEKNWGDAHFCLGILSKFIQVDDLLNKQVTPLVEKFSTEIGQKSEQFEETVRSWIKARAYHKVKKCLAESPEYVRLFRSDLEQSQIELEAQIRFQIGKFDPLEPADALVDQLIMLNNFQNHFRDLNLESPCKINSLSKSLQVKIDDKISELENWSGDKEFDPTQIDKLKASVDLLQDFLIEGRKEKLKELISRRSDKVKEMLFTKIDGAFEGYFNPKVLNQQLDKVQNDVSLVWEVIQYVGNKIDKKCSQIRLLAETKPHEATEELLGFEKALEGLNDIIPQTARENKISQTRTKKIKYNLHVTNK